MGTVLAVGACAQTAWSLGCESEEDLFESCALCCCLCVYLFLYGYKVEDRSQVLMKSGNITTGLPVAKEPPENLVYKS